MIKINLKIQKISLIQIKNKSKSQNLIILFLSIRFKLNQRKKLVAVFFQYFKSLKHAHMLQSEMIDYIISFVNNRQMQIKLNKPLTELGNLLIRNNLQPTPKRTALLANPRNYKENTNSSNLTRSPNKSASRKTLASKDDSLSITDGRQRAKSRKLQNQFIKSCQNHEENEGNFHINIEGEDLFYCEKCAQKLKNQGFPIKKIDGFNAQTMQKHDHDAKRHLLIEYSRFKGNPQFEILKQLLENIYGSQKKIISTEKHNLDQLHNKISSQLDSFYDRLEYFIRNKREQSKAELQSLKEALNQRENQQISQALEQIQSMKRDIQQNVQSIIGEVEQDTFQQCVQNYQQRLGVLNSLAEKRQSEIQRIRLRSERLLQQQYQIFQTDIQKIGFQTVSCSSQKVLNSEIDIHEQKGPFRNLFTNERDRSRKRLISRK